MTEIQFFGTAKDSKVPYFGKAVSAWNALAACRANLNVIGVNVPYTYTMTLEEAQEVNSKSFSWPLRVLVSSDSDESVYVPFKHAKNSSEFRKIIANLSEDSSIIVSRYPIDFDDNNRNLYLAVDGVSVQHDSMNYPISFDMSELFEYLGLDKNLAYRLGSPGSGNWTIDAIIDRNNEFFDSMTGSNVFESDDESLNSFRRGFFEGYNSEEVYGAGRILRYAIPLGESYLISGDAKSANLQGFVLGQIMKSKLSKHFSGLLSLNEAGKVKAIAKLGKENIAQFNFFATVHNAIVDGDRDLINSSLTGFFKRNKMSATDSYGYVNAFSNEINTFLSQLVSLTRTSKWDAYTDALSFDFNMDFELTEVLSFKAAQFRILKSEPNKLSIRFQSKTITGKKNAVMSNGKVYKVAGFDPVQVEVNIQIDNFSKEKVKAISALNYSQSSQAGTNVKYAPVVIDGDNLVATENGTVICSVDTLSKSLAGHWNSN